MAFPQYNPYYQQPFFNQPPVQNNMQMQQPQIQNSGTIINIPSEVDARSYPVALGNSITFKDDNAPYIYTKTMGFSQFDKPTFEKYRLVKENDNAEEENPVKFDTHEFDDLKEEIQDIRDEIDAIKKKIAPKTVKRIMKEIEVDDDDTE